MPCLLGESPRGNQVGGLPRVASVATRGEQEIDNLGPLFAFVLEFLTITNIIWKQKSLQFFTLFQMVLASLPGKICKSSKKLDLGLAHRLTMRAGMYSLCVRIICRSWRLLGSLWGLAGAPGRLETRACSESSPRGNQVGGLPRVASR